MRRIGWMVAAAVCVAAPAEAQRRRGAAAVEEVSLADLSARIAAGQTTSETATRAYLARISAMDRRGPTLRSVIAVNPDAIAQARAADARAKAKRRIGPLDGVPILVKDNVTRRDAPVVARLRAAGAVILGKTNLSEWANIRSTRSMSGWSAVGGMVRNPYALDRTACGSSSGSGAAVAASFAAAALGTETDGSVVCPSAINGLVGLKPTVGAVSRTHVVPISHSQDTPGPMARSVRDAAILYSAMVGSDPADSATRGADAQRRDYAAGLSDRGLQGVRVAVMRPDISPDLSARFDAALAAMRRAGATLVEVKRPPTPGLGDAELQVLQTELKADLDSYLATTPPAVRARTLDAVIAFNAANAAAEMPYFAQETFLEAAKTKGLADADYRAAREKSQRAAAGAIDTMLRTADATVLVAPTYGAAWLTDPVHGDQTSDPSASQLPAVSGYPHLTVPMGLVDGLPVGVSFIGPANSEQQLLAAGYAFERVAAGRTPPRYLPSADAGAGMDGSVGSPRSSVNR